MLPGDARLNNHLDTWAVDSPCTHGPELSEVLHGTSTAPWTLEAFASFLDHNYCGEVLEFTLDVAAYRNCYDQNILHGEPQSYTQNVAATYAMWHHILGRYIKPNADREINISGAAKYSLLAHQDPMKPPAPGVLQPAYEQTMDLMSDIFLQFVESVRPCRITVVPNSAPCYVEHRKCAQGSIRGRLSIEDDESVPFYRRAHGAWGSSRVYRKIKHYRGEFRSKSSSPELGSLPAGGSSTDSLTKSLGSPTLRSRTRW